MSSWRPPTIFDSFNYAFEGIIHVLRTQRNMRIHFVVAIAVIVFFTRRAREREGVARSRLR